METNTTTARYSSELRENIQLGKIPAMDLYTATEAKENEPLTAAELFSFFTANIIEEKAVFTR